MNRILVNGLQFEFSPNHLPCLIYGARGAGSSLFTVTAAAQLFSRGHKLIFLCGYPMAREEFLKQMHAQDRTLLLESPDQIHRMMPDAVFILKDNQDLFAPLVTAVSGRNRQAGIGKRKYNPFRKCGRITGCAVRRGKTIFHGHPVSRAVQSETPRHCLRETNRGYFRIRFGIIRA